MYVVSGKIHNACYGSESRGRLGNPIYSMFNSLIGEPLGNSFLCAGKVRSCYELLVISGNKIFTFLPVLYAFRYFCEIIKRCSKVFLV